MQCLRPAITGGAPLVLVSTFVCMSSLVGGSPLTSGKKSLAGTAYVIMMAFDLKVWLPLSSGVRVLEYLTKPLIKVVESSTAFHGREMPVCRGLHVQLVMAAAREVARRKYVGAYRR